MLTAALMRTGLLQAAESGQRGWAAPVCTVLGDLMRHPELLMSIAWWAATLAGDQGARGSTAGLTETRALGALPGLTSGAALLLVVDVGEGGEGTVSCVAAC